MHYFELLYQAKEIILEMEVEYWTTYSMVDYICTIGDSRIGVSVTRAMGYPTPDLFQRADAEYLLKKKLYGLIVSRNAVSDKHSFYRSVLHVWCQTQRIADLLSDVFKSWEISDFGLEVQGTIILLLTVCQSPGIYCNDRKIFV